MPLLCTHNRLLVWCMTALFVAVTSSVPAGQSRVEDSRFERIELFPESIQLSSSRAQMQIVVTGHLATGEILDLTDGAEYVSGNEGVVALDGSRAIPKGNGRGTIEVRVGRLRGTIPVLVTGQSEPDPVRFRSEVLAVLTRQGCNAGSCHGAPEGKNGFRLSMLAYAPHIDEESLIHGGLCRRIEPIAPDESLLLRKPLLHVAHVGGKRLRAGGPAHRLLRDWISEGARPDPPGTPSCVGFSIHPSPARILRLPEARQQLSVLARFSDGSVRDVTPLATYESSDKTRLTCDGAGLVRGTGRGVAAVAVRYLSHVQSIHFTIVEDVPGFVWRDVPEASYVDRLVHNKLRELQYLPGERCDDGTFLRRVSLDLTGLLPGADAARSFLADARPDKREQLIDGLLASEEFARFQGLRTADPMRVSAATLKDGRAELFAAWLSDSWRRNEPFDQFARALLTATGDTKVNGPANYFLAIPGNEDIAETTAQLFMGSRINCAKCHNHPFENWTQDDYFRIAAVFVRATNKMGTISLEEAGEVKHPATGATLAPWGSESASAATDPLHADRRENFVRWLTRHDNPYFARVEVNRIWAHLLGRGIVHPVDDFRSSNPPANPELLDALAEDFRKSGYDRRHIFHTICRSQTYQHSAAQNAFNADDHTFFSHFRPRRLSAEQIQDAIGFVSRTLPPTTTVDPQRRASQQELGQLIARLPSEREAWETAQREKLGATPCWQGSWRYIAFQAKSSDEAIATTYPPESEPGLDFTRTYDDGKVKWQPHPEWDDGRLIFTFDGRIGPHLLARKIYARRAGQALLSIGTCGGLKLRVNGQVVLDNPGHRALKEDDQRVEIDLVEGENTLLLKTLNTGGGLFGFYFDLVSFEGEPVAKFTIPESLQLGLAALGLATPRRKTNRPAPAAIDVPVDVAELVVIPAAARTDAQRQALIALQESTDPRLKGLRDRVQRLTHWLDYQTQRPYPEQSEFLRAFGQPKRESPCACERSAEPTIAQALQFLNGDLVRGRTATGAQEYARIDNDERLVEELYLSALTRFPSDEERKLAGRHVGAAGSRVDAIQDLLWALLNTREFLFQH